MQLTDYLYRITAPNPGFMTGNGTNSYLIKAATGDRIVIDPGPAIDSHIQAIIHGAGGAERIKIIAVTHMHTDNSPAATPLASLTGAFFFSSRRRHTRCGRDWSSDVCSSDLRALNCVGRSCVLVCAG